jgi:hypothetical protein
MWNPSGHFTPQNLYVIPLTNNVISDCPRATLAVADLLFASWIPFIATTRVTHYWIFGNAICKLVTYVQFLSGISSILTMMVISIERYTCVMYSPHRKMSAKLHISKKNRLKRVVFILNSIIDIVLVFTQNDHQWK